MAKGNIDPAFQAAPYLGDSSHDPIEFVRRQNAIKYQRSQQKQAEIERNTAKGLDKLMIDLDGWNDKEGFKEVISRQQKAKSMYMDLATKGVNFVNPTTEGEVMAYKALTDYQAKTKEIADLRNAQKTKIDLANKLIQTDKAKPEEDQLIDHEATKLNTEKALSTKTIAERDDLLNNLIVTKPQIGDSYKYVEDHKNALPKLDQIQVPYTDPETGQTGTRLQVQWTPEKMKETEKKLRELYRAAPEKIKNAVKIYKDRTPELKIATEEDAFVAQHMPEYAEKLITKPSAKSGGLSLNFLGQKTIMEPGRQRKEPLVYGTETFTSPYEFASTKPMRVPLGAQGSEMFDGKTWRPLTRGGDVEASLSFYDSNTDKFIFRTTQAGAAPFVMNNMTIAVPRAVIGDQADELPIETPEGVKKLKDVYGAMKTVKNKIPGTEKNFWSTPAYTPKKK